MRPTHAPYMLAASRTAHQRKIVRLIFGKSECLVSANDAGLESHRIVFDVRAFELQENNIVTHGSAFHTVA